MAQPAYQPPVQPAPAYQPTITRRTWGWGGLAVRLVLALVGAAGLVIGAFLDWVRSTAGTDISLRALWSTRFGHASNNLLTTVGFVAIVLGLLAIVGLAPRSGWLTRLAGALGVAAWVLFLIEVYRANQAVSDLDVGAWIVLAGSLVALVGGFFGTRTAVITSGPAPTP